MRARTRAADLTDCSPRNKVWERFARLNRQGRLAHAYLFTGPEGIGKSEAALRVAKTVNCPEAATGEGSSFCDRCETCVKINAGHHPDVIVIDRGDGQTIKIEKVREFIARTQLRAFSAPKKVVIIKEVDRLTVEGGNALLKTLEEPGPETLLLLTSAVPEQVLETIRSRCHTVPFFPMDEKTLAARLEEEGAAAKPAARFLARFAQGCPARAFRLLGEDFFTRKNEIIDHMIFEHDHEKFLKGILNDKDKTKQLIDVLFYWFRDLVLLKAGMGQPDVVHGDRWQDLQELSSRVSYEQLKDCLGQTVMACRMFGDNLNVKIPLALLKEKIWVRSYRSI